MRVYFGGINYSWNISGNVMVEFDGVVSFATEKRPFFGIN